jgi:copper homeostasis protein CutC
MNATKQAMATAMLGASLLGSGVDLPNFNPVTLHNGVNRVHTLWEEIHLSKAWRKGKTPEEMEAKRKEIYEAAQAALKEKA